MNDPARRHGADHGPAASWRRGILVLAAAIFAGTSLWTGIRGFIDDLNLAFRNAPGHAIPPEIQEQARILRAKLLPGDSLLYLGNQKPPDNWFPRLWRRALYPTPVLILERERSAVKLDIRARPRAPRLEDLRKTYRIRYALSAGNPPDDPGFASHADLPPIPGYGYTIWFGELRP